MYAMVSAKDLDGIFAHSFGAALIANGFVQADHRKWVRSQKLPIRDVFCLTAMKGASYAPCWGFSLDFVPHLSGSSIRWHGTVKAAMCDLCYDPIDYTNNVEEWTVSGLFGRDAAKSRAEHLARKSLKLALPWFASVNEIQDLRRQFELAKERSESAVRFGFYNYLQHPLAYAFVLAQVGQLSKAEAELKKYSKFDELTDTDRNKLLRLLKEQGQGEK